MSDKYILGLSAFYHDSAACLLRGTDIVAAGQEERFTRKKGDSSFPHRAVEFCLTQAGITIGDVSAVGFYDKPLLKFERILETYLGVAPKGFKSFLMAGPLWIKDKLYIDRQIKQELGYDGDVLYSEHHESHAASAFFPSPFEHAAVLTIDGVGEWATASIGVGRGNDIEILDELHWPDSLGLLYSAFTYYTGFKVNSGEYKVMGLAPYGEPKYVDLIYKELIDLREDGSFRLNQKYFNYLTGLTMTNGEFDKLIGGPPREPESKLTQREMDLARSVQEVCEEIMLRMARTAHKKTGAENLCLAGGVALNCVGNGRLLREGPFKRIWIQPAAGDAGGALGVAQLIAHRHFGLPRVVDGKTDAMKGSYLGPEFSAQRDRGVPEGDRGAGRAARRRVSVGARGAGAGRREDRRLVRRADGVRPARARGAQHPRRRAQPADAGADEHQDQVPRGVPAVRARGPARARLGVLRARRGIAVHAARRAGAARSAAFR